MHEADRKNDYLGFFNCIEFFYIISNDFKCKKLNLLTNIFGVIIFKTYSLKWLFEVINVVLSALRIIYK